MEERITQIPEDDWTPVARSTSDPVAVMVLPDETFELEDLRDLAQALEQAGLPVLIAESAEQRRIIADPHVAHVVIQIAPALKDVFTGIVASAAWDGIKAAFGRLRRRGQPTDSLELTIDVQIKGDRLVASGRGPAVDALADIARTFVEQANQAGG